jgi:hypothetical protein
VVLRQQRTELPPTKADTTACGLRPTLSISTKLFGVRVARMSSLPFSNQSLRCVRVCMTNGMSAMMRLL